ncbi:MAG: hypothetical protein GY765_33940, partial [bacterium]|nr:hypothetical protein [bacterium]
YNTKFEVKSYPTFKLISQKGTVLETAKGLDRTVKGFVDWITLIKSGNSLGSLKEKLQKNPRDEKTMVKLAKRYLKSKSAEAFNLLKKASGIKPLSRENNGLLLTALYNVLAFHEDSFKKDFAKDNKTLFTKACNAYFTPGTFTLSRDDRQVLTAIMGYYNALDDCKKSMTFFDKHLKNQMKSLDFVKSPKLVKEVLYTLLHMERGKDAEMWLAKLQAVAESKKGSKDKAVITLLENYGVFVDYYGKKKMVKKAEGYAHEMMERMKYHVPPIFLHSYKIDYGHKYLLFADETIRQTETVLKSMTGVAVVGPSCMLAPFYARKGNAAKAKKLLMSAYTVESMKLLTKKLRATFYANIVKAMITGEIVDETTLKVAQDAVKEETSATNLDILAVVHAALGNFKEAVKAEVKAIEVQESNNKPSRASVRSHAVQVYKQKLATWRKSI